MKKEKLGIAFEKDVLADMDSDVYLEYEYELLEDKFDIYNLPYNVKQNNLTVFLKEISESLFKDKLIKIDYYEYVMKVLDYANNFYEKGIGDVKTLKMYRIEVWSLHEQYEKASLEKNLARVIVCCFYDEKHPSVRWVDLGLYFDLLNDVNPTYCKKYREFCEIDLKAYEFPDNVDDEPFDDSTEIDDETFYNSIVIEAFDGTGRVEFDESALLEEKIDIDKVPDNVLQNSLAVFLKGVVKSLFNDKLIKIFYYEYAMKVLDYASDFHGKGIGDVAILSQYRSEVWDLNQKYEAEFEELYPEDEEGYLKGTLESNLARVIVCCLYEKSDPNGQDPLYFLYFDLLKDVNPAYCKLYREFCEVDLKAYAYKTKEGE